MKTTLTGDNTVKDLIKALKSFACIHGEDCKLDFYTDDCEEFDGIKINESYCSRNNEDTKLECGISLVNWSF